MISSDSFQLELVLYSRGQKKPRRIWMHLNPHDPSYRVLVDIMHRDVREPGMFREILRDGLDKYLSKRDVPEVSIDDLLKWTSELDRREQEDQERGVVPARPSAS